MSTIKEECNEWQPRQVLFATMAILSLMCDKFKIEYPPMEDGFIFLNMRLKLWALVHRYRRILMVKNLNLGV